MSKMTNERGDQIWWNEFEQFHREDGPAFIHKNGSKSWYLHGARHRVDGPAIICQSGDQEWWVNGVEITYQAIAWIRENDFPDYTLWSDTQKVMFLLAFAGIAK